MTSNSIGYTTEKSVMELLNSFEIISKVWKDLNNSKFDIYYTLKNENIIRGLQVKTIGKIKSRNGYQMNHLDRYIL